MLIHLIAGYIVAVGDEPAVVVVVVVEQAVVWFDALRRQMLICLL